MIGRILLPLLAAALLAGCKPARTAAPATAAPPLAALAGDYFPLASAAAGRTYHIYVRLPQDYAANPAARYPVVYVLDGDSLFPMLAPAHLFLTYDDKLPEAIVVGIAYGGFDPAVNKRHFDFMPPGSDDPANAPGAPAFAAFLKRELIPAVEARFRGDPARRILVGQSRGGSFVLYSAYTDPDLFWGRIASNPGLRPTRDFFYAPPAPGERRDLSLVVVTSSGDQPDLLADRLPWLEHMRGEKTPWAFHDVRLANATHAANIVDAYRAGLRLMLGTPQPGQ